MNKEQLEQIVLSLLDKAFLEHTKTYWLDDVEVNSIKEEVKKAINSYVEEQ